MKPDCFDTEEQYRIWVTMAKVSHQFTKVQHCLDCTPEYQARMLAAGRCACPEIRFGRDKDGFICGYRPVKTEGYKSIKGKRMDG